MSYLTNNEIQKKFNISRTTLYRLEQKGLPYIGTGRGKRYDEAEVRIFLENIDNEVRKLIVGRIYENETLSRVFGCGTQGGMRRSHASRALVLILDHTKSLYEDEWRDDILLYTGMGQEGDQQLDKQNKTLDESNRNGINVHLFEVFRGGEYVYRGPVKLVDTPYQQYQKDVNGSDRKVWIFPVKLQLNKPIDESLIDDLNNLNKKKAAKMSDEELKKRAERSNKGGTRRYTGKSYIRNEFVSEYVKRRANGACDLCAEKAPFTDKNGKPYLESHHVKWLSNGGSDSIDNCVALCPNCHRKIHNLNLSEDNLKLKGKLAYYKKHKL